MCWPSVLHCCCRCSFCHVCLIFLSLFCQVFCWLIFHILLTDYYETDSFHNWKKTYSWGLQWQIFNLYYKSFFYFIHICYSCYFACPWFCRIHYSLRSSLISYPVLLLLSLICSVLFFFPPLWSFLLSCSCLTSLIFSSKIRVAYWWYCVLFRPFKYTGIFSVLLLQSLSPEFPHHLATLLGPQRGLCPVFWPSAPLQCCLSTPSLMGKAWNTHK